MQLKQVVTLLLALFASGCCRRSNDPFERIQALAHVDDDVITRSRSARPPHSGAAQVDKLLSSEISKHIKDTMELWNVRGMSLAIVRKRPNQTEGFEVETYGFGNRSTSGASMTPSTLVPIASNSKQFAAAGVGLLVERQDVPIKWTTKFHEIFDGFELQDPIAQQLANLEDAFSHRTGIPRHDSLWGFHNVSDPDNLSLRQIRHVKPSASFRDVYQYNNHWYNIAASVVIKLVGTPFAQFVQRNIFDRAGFNDTTYDVIGSIKRDALAEGFWRHGETLNNSGTVYTSWPDVETHAGSAGILSNANDMAIWLQTLLNGGESPITGHQVIPTAVLQALTAGRTVAASREKRIPELGPNVYGMGFFSSSYQGHQYIEHDGSLPGYQTQAIHFPNDGLGLAVLVNDDRGTYVYESVIWRIAEDLLGMPLRVDWNDRYKSAHKSQLEINAEREAGRQPSPPGAPPPAVPVEQLAGNYSHPAYGSLLFSVTVDGALVSETPEWNGARTTLTLRHFTGNLFNATRPVLKPVTSQPEPVLFYETSDLEVEFEVSDGQVTGFGLWGGFWGAGPTVESPSGSSAREKAEVWFDRDELLTDGAALPSQSPFHI